MIKKIIILLILFSCTGAVLHPVNDKVPFGHNEENIVSVWSLDSNGNDYVGGHDVTARNNATYDTTNRKFGNAAGDYDGTTDSFETTDGATWGGYTIGLTVIAWVKSSDVNTRAIVGQYESIAGRLFLLYFSGDSLYGFVFETNPTDGGRIGRGDLDNQAQIAIESGGWHMVAMVFDLVGQDLLLYCSIDDVMVQVDDADSNKNTPFTVMNTTTENINIGSRDLGNDYDYGWLGQIDEVAFFSEEIKSAQEIQAIYNRRVHKKK